ncbi:MAG: HDOD domain-containing protein [Planctomycetota bacterium]
MSSASTRSSTSESVAQERLKRVVSRIYDLPSFPAVIAKLTEVAENPDSSCKDIAKVLSSDQGLSAKILKLVNSAFYSFSTPVSSLQHAITLLGFNTVRSLALSVSVKNMFRAGSVFPSERFWQHSLIVAIGAKLFAERNHFPLKDDVFTAGLLHDLGILLEARYFPDEMEQILEAVREGTLIEEAEEKHLGVHHGVLGAWLAEKWRLPPGLREPILRHREMESANPDPNAMAPEAIQALAFVTLANMIARGMGYSLLETSDAPQITIPVHLQAYLGQGPMSDVIPQIRDRFAESQEFLAL